ncbi:hypothetical protein BH10PSE6_BH10PSE6_13370 [soil metagenome]
MGRTDGVAPDPSVADYRATSPRKCAGRSLTHFSSFISWNTSFAVSNASRTDGTPI